MKMLANKFNRFSFALVQNSCKLLRNSSSKTVVRERIEYFEGRLGDWWDPNGSYKILHRVVPFRVNFMLQELGKRGMIKEGVRPFEGLKMLDVGCGVGITSERLCELGGDVTGIEPSDKIIQVAKQHALNSQHKLQYHVSTIEDFANNNDEQPYDVITVFWVLDHAVNKEEFVRKCISLLKPGGSLFIQTCNKCWQAGLSILYWHMYVTKFIPKNAGLYELLTPNAKLFQIIDDLGCRMLKVQGVKVKLFGKDLYLTNSNKCYNLFHVVK